MIKSNLANYVFHRFTWLKKKISVFHKDLTDLKPDFYIFTFLT